MAKRFDNILQTIGNTPVVRINKLAPKGVNLFVKVESFNPMASVKDRLALGVIEDAEAKGELLPGQTIVEASSGNTGIALAMVCAQKGYPLVITMAENFSLERRKMIRFLGAQVILTPAEAKGSGMVAKAQELAEEHGWWQPKQFENPANADIHSATTAQEILADFADIYLDYWVSGFGTGGTALGVARVLKKQNTNTKVYLCEPDNSQMLASGIIQARNKQGDHTGSHPNFRPHLMQGWSPDFVPKIVESLLREQLVDGFIPVDGNFSLQCAQDLAQKEGIFVGISAGATFAGALKIAQDAAPGSNILCMLPDTGERYLSTPLFDQVSVEMNAEEQLISKSTSGYRFDIKQTVAPNDEKELIIDAKAQSEVQALIHDNKKSVVMFALEWCEFCWSVRKVFSAYGIEFDSVDLDSLAYSENNRGGKIRTALHQHTSCNTFPQIFINGQFIGGCTDLFDGMKDGRILTKLEQLNISYDKQVTINPYDLLPSCLHPR
jgi:cysteine synthase A